MESSKILNNKKLNIKTKSEPLRMLFTLSCQVGIELCLQRAPGRPDFHLVDQLRFHHWCQMLPSKFINTQAYFWVFYCIPLSCLFMSQYPTALIIISSLSFDFWWGQSSLINFLSEIFQLFLFIFPRKFRISLPDSEKSCGYLYWLMLHLQVERDLSSL